MTHNEHGFPSTFHVSRVLELAQPKLKVWQGQQGGVGGLGGTLLKAFFFAQNCSCLQAEELHSGRRMGLNKVVNTLDRGLQIAQLVLF